MTVPTNTPVRVKISQFIMREKDLLSREFDGVITRVSARGAVLFQGHVTLAKSESCRRCGLKITNPVSRWCGFGPICSGYLGIDRPEALDEEQQASERNRIALETQVEMWLPPSTKITLLDAPVERQPEVINEWNNVNIFVITKGGNFHVRFPYNAVKKDKLKLAGARWDPVEKEWYLPRTVAAVQAIETVFAGDVIDVDQPYLDLWHRWQVGTDTQGIKRANSLPAIPGIATDAWLHQRQAFWFVAELWGGLPSR